MRITLNRYIQILAKLAFGDALFEVRVGGGDHPHIDALRAVFPNRHDLALLEEAQQLRLHVEWEVADFIQEQRAAGRGPDQPGLIRDRAGKRSATMAEQLAVGQLTRRRRAVIGEEGGSVAGRSNMDGARDQLLAGAALARD